MQIPTVVVCPLDGTLAERFRKLPLTACRQFEMGVHTGRIRGVVGSLALFNPWGRIRFKNIVSEMRDKYCCDTVLCQYPREQALVTSMADAMGYRVIWLVHSKLHYLSNRALVNPMLRRAMSGTRPAFIISQSTRHALLKDGFPESVMKVLPVGVDAPRDIGSADRIGHFRAGIVCRLVRLKGVQDILRAAPQILKRFPNIEFLVAGEGRYRRTLEKLAIGLGISGFVRFLGFIENPLQVYAQIDVLAHTTFDPGDSMPTNILEAAAVGVPTVATRWAGIPEIVRDGETGLLVEPRDVNGIAEAILKLATDRQLSVRLGENARDYVTQNFSMKRVANAFIGQLEEAFAVGGTSVGASSP